MWTTFSKSAIRNKKLNVQVSLSRDAAQSLNAAIPGTATGLSPARMAGAAPPSFASPSHQSASPPSAPVGARGYDPDSGRRGDVGRGGGGGGGLEDDSRMLAHKYEDVSASRLVGWLISWLVGRVVVWLGGWLVGRLVGWLV